MCNKKLLLPMSFHQIIIVFLISLLCFYSCSEKNEEDLNEDVEWFYEYSQLNKNGFTIYVKTKQVPSKGIVVAYRETQNCFGKKGLKKALSHALSHYGLLGGWLNVENGLYYFDSDTLFQESMLKEAIEWGQRNNQHSVFILSTNETIPCK